MLQLPVCYTSGVESILAHLWPISRWEATPECPGSAWHGSCHSWAGWGRARWQDPPVPLSFPLNTSCGLWAGLTPCSWAAPSHIIPRMSEPSAFQPLLRSPGGYIPRPGMIKQQHPHYLISCSHHSPNSSRQAYLGRCGLWGWLQVDICFFAVCSSGQKPFCGFRNVYSTKCFSVSQWGDTVVTRNTLLLFTREDV